MTTLITRSGKPLKEYSIKPEHFLSHNTFIYGESESGKTFIIRDILYHLKDMVQMIFLISPTGLDSDSFDGIVPYATTFTEISKVREEFLDVIWERQKVATILYETGNNIKLLSSVYEKIKHFKIDNQIQELERNRNKLIAEINKRHSTDSFLVEKEQKQIDKYRDKQLIRILKSHIINNLEKLRNFKLTTDEQKCIQYMNFNHNIVVILDDCAAEANQWATENKKTGKSTMKEMLYQGRHKGVTLIGTFQDDKTLRPPFRRNAHNSIFADPNSALGFFGSVANAIPKDTFADVKEYIQKVFSGEKDNYKKLWYLKGASPKFYHYTATGRTNFRVGSQTFWDYCLKIEDKKIRFDGTNRFTKKFGI
jgi:Fe2+ or Zn2+ uptake regulation protein